jgi:hypothetical protein
MLNAIQKCGFAALVLVTVSFAQTDGRVQVQKEMERTRRELESEKQMLLSDQARRDAWEKASRQRLTELRAEIRRAQRESDSLQRVRDALEAQSRTRTGDKGKAERVQQAFASALATEIELAAKQLDRELPDLADARRREFGDLTRGLRAGLVTPADGVRRFSNLMVGVADVGGRVEVVRGNHTLSTGRELQGHFVRVGGIFEAFVGDDSTQAAVRQRSTEGGWAWNENFTSFQKMELRRIVRIATAGEKPGFVTIPFGLSLGVIAGDQK